MLRQIATDEWEAAADFLDEGAWALRWLVAYLRRDTGPEDADDLDDPVWDVWGMLDREELGAGALCAVLAFSHCSRTLYIHGGADIDPRGIHELCCETFSPAKLVGDGGLLEAWERKVPTLGEATVRRREVVALEYVGSLEETPGFRQGRLSDASLIGEFLRLLRVETDDVGEEIDPGLLIEHGLVYVVEEDARVQGMILSNLSDGRYVHAGSVFVHPAYRGRGVGRRLAAGLGREVRATLGSTVILDAFQENRSALAAYERAGYRPVGRGLALWVQPEAWE